MEAGSLDSEVVHFCCTDFDAERILPRIQGRLNLQSLSRGGMTDETDDDFMALERFATPVGGDVTEQAMLDLIPLTRPWRQMTDTDSKLAVVGEALQLAFPQSSPSAVAAAAVGGNEQRLGLRIICSHHARIEATAKAGVSWSTPTLTQPVFACRSYTP